MNALYSLFGRSVLFSLDAEKAHGLSIAALSHGLHPRFDGKQDARLHVNIAGLSFPNPLGMAAGYDKNGDVPDALLAMGFGHTEVGTITPKPQPGNPKPRVFRLPADRAVINRLGFNSQGHDSALKMLNARRRKHGIVGINIGANKTSDDFAADYVLGIGSFSELADYFTVNISSPNTPGLRALQGADPLSDLLQRVSEKRAEESDKHKRDIPVFLKIAPDLDESELDDITKALSTSDFDGLIVSNTTLSRSGLTSFQAKEAGGLSGKPLFERSTIVLAKMAERLGKSMPLIGVGGVMDADTAFAKIEAGASLVQLYSGLIYGGPTLPKDILKGLSRKLDKEKIASIEDVVGRATSDCANKPIPA